MTPNNIEVVRKELKALAHAREIYNEVIAAANLMGNDKLAHKMGTATRLLALAEGEIEAAVFGARGAA
jgi:hypothetical protein